MDMFQQSVMTPMSNFAIGSYMATTGSIAHGTKIIHLGKFVREEYFDNILKYKVFSYECADVVKRNFKFFGDPT
jgi:hypothetical protein